MVTIVANHPNALKKAVQTWREAGESIAFVPTMGNLHAGHVNLIKAASGRAQRVVVSVFVNPLQFGPDEDFDAYPRTVEDDLGVVQAYRVDLFFIPQIQQLYPNRRDERDVGGTMVCVPDITDGLCGESRPGHFNGVTTVVTKLLNLVQPDFMMLGKKDYQQLRVLERCAADLCMPVEVVGCDTIREYDGLAMSSRNAYLSDEERISAPNLYAELEALKVAIETSPEQFDSLRSASLERLRSAGFVPEYMELRKQRDLSEPALGDDQLVLLAAAKLGKTRLIDNIELM